MTWKYEKAELIRQVLNGCHFIDALYPLVIGLGSTYSV